MLSPNPNRIKVVPCDRHEWDIELDGEYVASLHRAFHQRYSYSGSSLYANDMEKPCYWTVVFNGKIGECPESIDLERGLGVVAAKKAAKMAAAGALEAPPIVEQPTSQFNEREVTLELGDRVTIKDECGNVLATVSLEAREVFILVEETHPRLTNVDVKATMVSGRVFPLDENGQFDSKTQLDLPSGPAIVSVDFVRGQ